MAVLRAGERTWVTVTDIDSSDGAYDYPRVCDGDAFAVIGQAATDAGIGRSGQVGASTTHIFPAPELVTFAIRWIDERFEQS